MINVAVVGATGYTGAELVRWILNHPRFNLAAATSDSLAGQLLSDLYPSFLGKTSIQLTPHSSVFELPSGSVQLAFLAVPHTAAMQIAPKLLQAKISAIDLSADFRLQDPEQYQKWYGVLHTAKDILSRAVYGLPELNFEKLSQQASFILQQGGAALVANPGCYPTASALAAFPALAAKLVDLDSCVVINAISGVSGAGVKATSTTHYCQANENINAYGVTSHRHTPEIVQTLSQVAGRPVKVQFTPHLAPLTRGMISTAAIQILDGVREDQIEAAYNKAFADHPFVQLLPSGQMPKSASVSGTNNAQLGWAFDKNTNMLVVSCAIDNLGKGAASQAIQNANIIFGLDQTAGLDAVGQVV